MHIKNVAAFKWEGTLENRRNKKYVSQIRVLLDVDVPEHSTRAYVDYGRLGQAVFNDGKALWVQQAGFNGILKTDAVPSALNPDDPAFVPVAPHSPSRNQLGPVTLARWLKWIVADRWLTSAFNSTWKASRPVPCPAAVGVPSMCWVLSNKRERVWIDQRTGWLTRYDFAKSSLKLSKVEEHASTPYDRFVPPATAHVTSDLVDWQTQTHQLQRAEGFPLSDARRRRGSLAADLKGKPVVLFFCVPSLKACQQVLATLEHLKDEDQINPAAMVILDSHGPKGFIEHSPSGVSRKMAIAPDLFDSWRRFYCDGALAPTTWIITRGGTLIHAFSGTVDESTLRAAILQAIAWPTDKEAPEPRFIE